MIMLTREGPDYLIYENYYLFNFCQLAVKEQIGKFYVKKIIPVSHEEHNAGVDIDSFYNCNIVNPIYQLFVSSFLYSSDFMNLVKALWGIDKFYDEINEIRENLFDYDYQKIFFDDVYFNTSLEGFSDGEYWIELRKRARFILEKCNLLDNGIEYNHPMKFSGFLYPDDFLEYKKYPFWSVYGEMLAFDEWGELRDRVFNSYKGVELNLVC